MAKILENEKGRRLIKLDTNDVINVVREYQNLTYNLKNYNEIRNTLDNCELYLTEDISI